MNDNAGQANAVYLVLQAMLIEARNRLRALIGERFNPGGSLKPGIGRHVAEDPLCPCHRSPKRFVQDRRMVSAHRFVAAEHSGGLSPPLALLSTPNVFFSLRRSDRGSRQGKTRNDCMGDPAISADTPQDHQLLKVVVLLVAGVGPQKPDYLTGRARGEVKQNAKRIIDFFKIVDFPTNIEYDDGSGLRAGRRAIWWMGFRPAFSFSLSFRIGKIIRDNLGI